MPEWFFTDWPAFGGHRYRFVTGRKLIINFPTKRHWKSPSTYEYVETGLAALVAYLKTNPVKSLAMPALGCGNGGLDWKLVKPMIEKHLGELDLSVWIYEPKLKGGI